MSNVSVIVGYGISAQAAVNGLHQGKPRTSPETLQGSMELDDLDHEVAQTRTCWIRSHSERCVALRSGMKL